MSGTATQIAALRRRIELGSEHLRALASAIQAALAVNVQALDELQTLLNVPADRRCDAPAAAKPSPPEMIPAPSNPAPLLVDTRGAAKVLGCSAGHVRNLAGRGELQPIRVGKLLRFSVDDLRQFAARAGR